MVFRELTPLSVVVRILAALLTGGILGLERGMKNRPAGLRTYMLVCMGACMVMMTNQFLYQQTGTGDPTRMGAQVVSGIGFLGAGTILVTHHNQIKGLTTAAGLWACAAVGLALGIGFYEAAAVGGIGIFVVLTLVHRWDDRMRMKGRSFDVYIELASGYPLGDFLRTLWGMNLELTDIRMESDTEPRRGTYAFVATVKTTQRGIHAEVLSEVQKIEGVDYLKEI